MKSRKRLALTEGFDYKYIDTNDEYENSPVSILKGTYTGMVVVFGTISVNGWNLHFEYKVLENPLGIPTDTEDFHFFLGELVANIIVNNK